MMSAVLRHILPIFLLFIASIADAQISRDLAAEFNAVVNAAQPSITLFWKPDTTTTALRVNRRVVGTTSWGSVKTVSKDSTQYIDTTVEVGKRYEYRLQKTHRAGTASVTANGYIRSGINVPADRNRGGLMLVIDTTYASDLKTELDRLIADLTADGYNVYRIDAARTDKVADIKQRLSDLYFSGDDNFTTLFLFGHVPVPYSGFLVPDGHPDHIGAWPADAFYGEFDGEWSDNVDESTIMVNGQPLQQSNIRPANWNAAGDGKYDQAQLPDAVDLQIGRVDFANMPAFAKSEKELLKQYLDKDHNYRIGLLTAPIRGLIDDNFGYFSGEAFASSGWRNLPAMVGLDSVREIDWFTTLETEPYLWAYGTGGGTNTSAGGIGSTADFASRGSKAIFTMLFGSYFGDWNTTDNFLRAPLATDYGLSCAWSGRPYWHFFPMALGEPLGYCARITQNNTAEFVFNNNANLVHIALMGDPTLRLYPVPPPSLPSFTSDTETRSITMTWKEANDPSVHGYLIYRSSKKSGPYSLLTTEPVIAAQFVDTDPLEDSNHYWIHSVRKEVSPTGSYDNLSLGIYGWQQGMQKQNVAAETVKNGLGISASTNSLSTNIVVRIPQTDRYRIELIDALGRSVRMVASTYLNDGEHRFDIDHHDLESGLYLVRLSGAGQTVSVKTLIVQ